MATTPLQVDRGPISIESYQENLQELTGLVTHHSPRFRRIALAHLGNVADAEDAFQDAVLAAFTHVGRFRGQAKISTWLTAIVINSARMKLRRRSLQLQTFSDETGPEHEFSLEDLAVDARPGPEEVCGKREISEILAAAASRLSPRLRRTFELRDLHGLSIRETASLLRVSRGTVKARTVRARIKLRETIRRTLEPASPVRASSSLRRIS